MSDDAADQGVAGVGLFIAGYTDEKGADGALDALKQAKDAGAFAYDDAAVISGTRFRSGYTSEHTTLGGLH